MTQKEVKEIIKNLKAIGFILGVIAGGIIVMALKL
jgi:hypothetical protein